MERWIERVSVTSRSTRSWKKNMQLKLQRAGSLQMQRLILVVALRLTRMQC
jgi:hypothetical protein